MKKLKLNDVAEQLYGNISTFGCPVLPCIGLTIEACSPCYESPSCPLTVIGTDDADAAVEEAPVEILEFDADDFDLEVMEAGDCGAHIKVMLSEESEEDELESTEVCVKGLIGYIITGQEGGVDIKQKVYIPWSKIPVVAPDANKLTLGFDEEGCLVAYEMADCEEEE